MRKTDEMEQRQVNKAGVIAFQFYSVALLIYSIYLFMENGGGGIPFIILMGGNIIFFGSLHIFKQKMK
ncbi:hypothetical protein [Salimicrobium flavidum]|uniref:Uncharacterized protein n=1 Tax=Salimicrobium flavidum TaxID=570947 RepID=A0A1N7JJ72_9BACI|nr:hypothetical protein [Salimicrobium flavidum]SIS49350.1 hypothetical protein SAMN05421687_106135 [Salimicrobium flavidum]